MRNHRSARVHRVISYSFLGLVLAGFLACVTPVAGQTAIDGNARKFLLATTYMKSGQFERAIALLEDLYAAEPETNAYFLRLKESYAEMKRYDEAIALIDSRMQLGPNPYLLAERGALLVHSGALDDAAEAWEQAILLAPDRSLSYREVYRAMMSVRMYDEAVDVLLRARTNLRFPSAFRSELADLFVTTGRNAEAMAEYIALIREAPDQQAYVRSRLARLGENEAMFSDALPVLEQAVRKDPTNRPIRELAAWVYREAGMFDKALDSSRAIDRLEGEQGRVLYTFALNAADGEAFEFAFMALDDIVRWYPDSPAAISARLGRADLHQRVGENMRESPYDGLGNRIPAPHFDAALEGYRSFMQDHPLDPRIPDVLWRMATLELNSYHNLGGAQALLQQIVDRHPESSVVEQAMHDLATIELLRGNLQEARLSYSRLENQLRIGELAERSRFELARIAYYQGQFESALTIADALDENTSADIANDAIELKVLLRENRGPDSLDTPLRKYAASELAVRQRQFETALDILDQLRLAYPKHALADEVAFKRALTLENLGRPVEAQSAYRDIAANFSESYLADRSLFAAARIFEEALGDPAAAIAAYTEVLIRYPGSLLAPDIRARIRKLRGDNV